MSDSSYTLAIARWLVRERNFSVIRVANPAATTQTDSKRTGKGPVIRWRAR
jgi:hypothetical protein